MRKSISLQDLHDAWNEAKKSSENYIGKPASESPMVRSMAKHLGLLGELAEALPFEDKHISPADAKFLREANKKGS